MIISLIVHIVAIVLIISASAFLYKIYFTITLLQEMQRINPLVPKSHGIMKWVD